MSSNLSNFNKIEMLYLSEEDVIATGLTMSKCIELVEEVIIAMAKGEVLTPPKVFLDMRLISDHQCDADAMPAYIKSRDICGIKWIGANWENRKKRNIPNVLSLIILNDPESFAPLAVISSNWLTGMRTGATTAIAVKLLAKKNSKSLALIGTGYEANFQLMAIKEVIKLDEVKAYDINCDLLRWYVKEAENSMNVNIRACKSVEEAIDGADIVVTITSSQTPVINNPSSLRDTTLLCSLGTYNELASDILNWADKIVVDYLSQSKYTGAIAEWFSKGLISDKDIYAEIGDILLNKKPGRVSDDERILCVLTGMGCEDIIVADYVYKQARIKNIGKILRVI